MTDPDWDNERLEAAFRAKFDRPAPSALESAIHAHIAGRSPARFILLQLRPGLGLAAVAGVVILVGTLALGVGGIGHRDESPQPSSSSARASPEASAAPTEQALPGVVVGLPIIHVSDAIAIRDAGVDDRELAVMGWFTPSLAPRLRCARVPDVSLLELHCGDSSMWLTEQPESTTAPTGPALKPFLDDLDSSWQPSNLDIKTDVVFVGHFDDRRASLCPEAEMAACRDRFVVDSVTFVEGRPVPLSVVREVPQAGAIAGSSQADIEAIVANEAPQSQILSMVVTDGAKGLARIEPSPAGQNGFRRQPVVWIVRVLETDRISTYVIVDGTDAIYKIDPTGQPIFVGGTLKIAVGSYEVECGSIGPDTCERRAMVIVAEYQVRDPSKHIVSIRLSADPCGSFNVTFDDGTGADIEIDCFVSPSPG